MLPHPDGGNVTLSPFGSLSFIDLQRLLTPSCIVFLCTSAVLGIGFHIRGPVGAVGYAHSGLEVAPGALHHSNWHVSYCQQCG